MRHAIAFLHTAQAHVPTFERLLGEAAPGLSARHVVRDDLLADARAVGVCDPALVARVHAAMQEAASGGAKVVACTCSTIGGIAEQTPVHGRFKALRIDRAMADRAVRTGPRVLVAAALQSTLAPTVNLVLSAASDAGVRVAPEQLLIADAWPHFEAGDIARYAETLATAIRKAAGSADVVVLAQASMAPATALLADLGIDVLSSPALGVAHVAAAAAAAAIPT
ncbi:Asp/Glu/hydantoin racemase [Variovorax paradoxus]|uniref:Asp/Glu/hydantoin racemase n=1 Tax=Variovorax paradoxus TaxID=34073 RepID=A0AA91DMM4_VARPD|nr:Asp/Glu/hydantoin racemase [Variovorax paradoxus]OAK61140.1 Asp/Glu/hydantoin racemase [Variovorax paradoxus]